MKGENGPVHWEDTCNMECHCKKLSELTGKLNNIVACCFPVHVSFMLSIYPE